MYIKGIASTDEFVILMGFGKEKAINSNEMRRNDKYGYKIQEPLGKEYTLICNREAFEMPKIHQKVFQDR